MKTLILGLIAICSVTLTFAQTDPRGAVDSNPINFLGIQVAGNLDLFLQKIEEKGFKISEESKSNESVLKGNFLGQNADVLVLSTKGTDQVYAVVVLLPQENNWNTLKANFKILKNSFVALYGKPEENSHHFTMPFDDVQDELQKVQLGMCDYSCSWSSPKITLAITKSARIMITYENDVNFQMYAGL